jgi:hypothetical protein
MFTQGKVELLDERSLDVSKLLMLEISAPPTPLVPVDNGKPELPRPDPSSIVAPMYHGAAEDFSSDPLLICPTIPISE